MGADGSAWEDEDDISVARMNQKTIYIGPSAPGTTYAGMFWYDTITNLWRERNGDNNAWLIHLSKYTTYNETVSDTLQHSNDTQQGNSATSATKEKEIESNVPLAAVRIKFKMCTTTEGKKTYGRIYKNGEAWGTSQETDSLDLVEFSEDLGAVAIDDLIQLYLWNDASGSGNCQDLRLYYTIGRKAVTLFTNTKES